MKIVIDISKDCYDAIMARDWKNAGWLFSEELKAIHDDKIVEQELCDNCISRQVVLEAIEKEWIKADIGATTEALSSVTPSGKQKPCEDAESVRQELLDRGDEMVSFRQLVERFDEVEDEYKGAPWSLRQIYNNFNILIGEKRLSDCISRQDAVNACRNGLGYDDETIEHIVGNILGLPSVTPAEMQEPKYCDRNICLSNEYNGISCDECEVMKSQEPCEDVCEWFEQYIDIATDIVEVRFSDGTVKRAKRGLYLRDIEKSIRKMLIDQIANEKKQEPKWIPVSERLPEKNGQYLVTTASATSVLGIPLVTMRSFAKNLKKVDPYDFRYAKGGGWYDYDSEVGHWRDTDVKAWMEFHFPEPYKASPEGAEGS